MGDGFKRVARLCGGLTVTARGETVRYDGEGKRVDDKAKVLEVWPDAVCLPADPERQRLTPRAARPAWEAWTDTRRVGCLGQGATEGAAWADAAARLDPVEGRTDA